MAVSSPDPLKLDIDAHVVRQLGDELITDTGQALLELIKNSYDADGDWCKVAIDTDREKLVELVDEQKASNQGSPPTNARAKSLALRGEIVVSDNGCGMSIEDIKRGWLLISLSPKRAFKAAGKTTPKHHRTPVGDKGLGRLGTIRLGNYIAIETHNDAKKEGVRVAFFWSDCASGTPLSGVKVTQDIIPPRGETGTRLYIYGLNELAYWRDAAALRALEDQLSTLISPFREFEGFAIEASVNGKPLHIQDAQRYLQHAQCKFGFTWTGLEQAETSPPLQIDGEIGLSLFKIATNDAFFEQHVAADNGGALFDFLKQHKLTRSLEFKRARGRRYITFVEDFSRDDLGISFNSVRYADPGPMMGEIHTFDFRESKQALELLAKQGLAPRFVNDYFGVFVFRDNFRIRMGEDWLQLGKSWTEGKSYYGLKPKNTLGWIAISAKENPQLIEKSDREGFVETSARRGFDHLTIKFRDTINEVLQRLRRGYVEFRKMKADEETGRPKGYSWEQALKDVENGAAEATVLTKQIDRQRAAASALRSATQSIAVVANSATGPAKRQLERATEELNNLHQELEAVRAQALSIAGQLTTLKRASEVIDDKIEDNNQQFRELYGMAALGLAAQGLIHELEPCIDMLLYATDQIKAISKAMNIRNPRLFERIEASQTNARTIGTRVRFLDPMLRTYRGKREVIDIGAFLADFKGFKESVLTSKDIRFNIRTIGQPVVARLNRGQITQVIDNLVRNSEYWLSLYLKEHPRSEAEVYAEIESPYLRIWDNGLGVDKKIEDVVFDLFATAKPAGEGHGLGLFLSRELLEDNKCSITLLPDRNRHGRRYKFQIDFSESLNEG